MIFSNIAIDPGVVFLAVALLMHLSMTGKFRSFGKEAPGIVLFLAVAVAAYWW